MIKQNFQKWFSDFGDKRHRIFSYGKLKPDDIYFDVGSYSGDFAKQFYNKHKCQIYCFEPVEKFYRQSANKMRDIDSAKCYHFGLGPKNEEVDICIDADASSLFLTSGARNIERVSIVCIDEFIERENIENIKVIKINIEGAEYDLLDHCLDARLTDKFENIQVQFHNFIDNCEARREAIRSRLAATHELTYDYPMIWENWRRKNA